MIYVRPVLHAQLEERRPVSRHLEDKINNDICSFRTALAIGGTVIYIYAFVNEHLMHQNWWSAFVWYWFLTIITLIKQFIFAVRNSQCCFAQHVLKSCFISILIGK